MPLLQESQPRRDLMNKIKAESEESLAMTASAVASYQGLHNGSLLTPGQLLAASQTAAFMAASGLPVSLHATLTSNPGLFHPSLFGPLWPTSPQSPPSGPGSPISPNSKARKHNNNNIVSSSSGDHLSNKPTPVRRKQSSHKTTTNIQETVERSPISSEISPSGQLSPPTSGSSPPSSTGEPTSAKEPGRDKQFTCGVCNRSFGYKHVLQNHERTHTGEKPFECPECHKRFTRDHHLKTHMRLHTGERPYHCDHCDRHFVQVANLRRHLRVHTGERPYCCEECSARFSDSNQLKAHALIHKGEKPFQCERCQGRFRRRHHLMHHKCGMVGVVVGGNSVVPNVLVAGPESPEQRHVEQRHHTVAADVKMEAISGTGEETEYVVDEDTPEDLSHSEKMRERKSRDIRRVIRVPSVAPLITLPLHVALPEQTEPEDLSMSTGHHHLHHHSHSHSSGDSPLSRSPCSDHREEDEEEDLDEAATLFLKHHPQRRHLPPPMS